jgi:hypothetical protein
LKLEKHEHETQTHHTSKQCQLITFQKQQHFSTMKIE